jgi:hypothetical protein
MNQTVIFQAYSRLKALKANLPDRIHADHTYVEEFDNILDILQKESGHDLSPFHVPASQMQRESSGGNYITGEVFYTGRTVCTRSYLMMRIDGVLGFFTLSGAKTNVGFTPI